jgi:long-subunit acyl-CoA synthetase (AMP-forming)
MTAKNSTAKAATVKDWTGNYNTVFAPAAELLAVSATVEVETLSVSTMLKQTSITGPDAKGFLASLVEIEAQAFAAMREWQKTQERKGQTDMEKYNQNRSFLAGFLAAAAQQATGAKRMPTIAFAKDMTKAVRPDAVKAGAAARKAAK